METLLQCLNRYKEERESKFVSLRLLQRSTNPSEFETLSHAIIAEEGTSTSDRLTKIPGNHQSMLQWYMGEDGGASLDGTSTGNGKEITLQQLLRYYNQLFSNLVEEVKAKKYGIAQSRSRIENQISIARSNELSLLELATAKKPMATKLSTQPSLGAGSRDLGGSANYARRSLAPLDQPGHKTIRPASEPPQALTGSGTTVFERSELLDLTSRIRRARPGPASKSKNEHENTADEEADIWSSSYDQVEREDPASRPLMGVDSQAHRLGRYSSHGRRRRRYGSHHWGQEVDERESEQQGSRASLDSVHDEFFLVGEGIHIDVLENEIAGFLGPDATFRTSTYEV